VKIVKKIAKYTVVIIVVDAVVVSVALYLADSAGKPPLYYEEEMPGFAGRIREAYKDYVGDLDLKHLFTTDITHLVKMVGRKPPEVLTRGKKDIAQDTRPMPATMALNGFSLQFRDNAHRLNMVRAAIEGVDYEPRGKSLARVASIAFDGGDWSRIDAVDYGIRALPVRAPSAKFVHMDVDTRLVSGRSLETVAIDFKDAGLDKYENVNAFLRGFHFETGENYPEGYNIKGMAVKITPVPGSAGTLTLDLVMEMKAGEVAFRRGPGYFYDMPATAQLTLVGSNDATFTRAHNHYMLLNREHAPEEMRRVTADVGPGPGMVVPVLQGFEFDIHTPKARYIREISLSLDDPQFDAIEGTASVLSSGYLSNDGTFAGALDVRFNSDVLFMKFPEGTVREPVSFDGRTEEVAKIHYSDLEAAF